jgi:thioredoxin-related protein
MKATAVALAGLLVVLLTACDREQSRQSASSEPAADGISWFQGSVEEASAAAREQDKPLLLYWGADWCPPCNELKVTVFKNLEFIEQSRLFIPVYLDGDTPRAQQYGERFEVWGYPTVVLFRPDGLEVTRIPGGIELDRYLDVLELVLNDIRPVVELVEAVTAGETIDDRDWELLAWYSWGQDRGRALGVHERHALFQQLANAVPEHLDQARSRLQLQAINAWMSRPSGVRDGELASEYRDWLNAILAEESLTRANLEYLSYDVTDLVGALHTTSAPLDLQQWDRQLAYFAGQPALSTSARVTAVAGRVSLAKASGEIPDELMREVESTVAWADAEARTGDERQTAISAAWSLLITAGRTDEAEALFAAELEKSHSPYVLMTALADMAAHAGREQEALAWLERAWNESVGAATRMQVGVKYLVGLMQFAPDDTGAVRDGISTLMSELDAQQEPLHGRNVRGLDRLSEQMLAWAEFDDDRGAIVEDTRQLMAGLCAAADEKGEQAVCRRFLREQDP